MKKALLAIVLTVAALVPVGMIASPASAAGCSAQLVQKSSSNTWAYAGGNWKLTGRATVQNCSTTTGDQYVKVSGYNVSITMTSGGCGTQWGHPVTGWRVNPDALGAWNPGQLENSACSGTFTFAPGGAVVWASSPANIRCISGGATPKLLLWPDGATVTIPEVCVI